MTRFNMFPLVAALVLVLYPVGVPAPVPRCSPFILINKVAEFSNIWSDSNPFFPVPPCEYGSPLNAIAAGDLEAVSVFARPFNIPRHNFYEFIWLIKTGIPRMFRVATGREPFIMDENILREGYTHSTRNPRTRQLGHGTLRRPKIINDKGTYTSVVLNKIRSLINEGPDRRPTAYTPQGPLRRSQPAAVATSRTATTGNRPRSTATVGVPAHTSRSVGGGQAGVAYQTSARAAAGRTVRFPSSRSAEASNNFASSLSHGSSTGWTPSFQTPSR